MQKPPLPESEARQSELVTHHSSLITLPDWLDYLDRIHPKTIEMGLERVIQVKQALGLAPSFPMITVGGTNGKGSVCAMLQSILYRAGYRVGCYTSPHLLRYNERVRVNREQVSDEALCRAFAAVEAARGAIPLTYFEFGTLAAMVLMIEAGVDVAILEVGLGGRLDAVNVFDADCAVITSVALDHMDYLGDSREKIGFEKAGIFRRGKVAVVSEPDVPDSVRQYALDIGTDFLHIGEDFGYTADKLQWSYWGYGGKRHALPYPALRGAYQLQNASACLAVLGELKDRVPVTMGDIRSGLLEVELPGRFQVLPGRPTVILDVAHNPHAAQALAANLGGMGFYQKTIAVFAMLKDKDMGGVVRALEPHIDLWLVAGIHQQRGAGAEDVVRVLRQEQAHGEIVAFETAGAAYGYACKTAGENDRILVFGSFYTVSEALQERERMKVAGG